MLATEGVVTALRAGRRIPERVRVDMVPSLASEDGVVGQALAASIVNGLPDGSHRFVDGRPQRVTPGHDGTVREGGARPAVTRPWPHSAWISSPRPVES